MSTVEGSQRLKAQMKELATSTRHHRAIYASTATAHFMITCNICARLVNYNYQMGVFTPAIDANNVHSTWNRYQVTLVKHGDAFGLAPFFGPSFFFQFHCRPTSFCCSLLHNILTQYTQNVDYISTYWHIMERWNGDTDRRKTHSICDSFLRPYRKTAIIFFIKGQILLHETM